MGTARKFKIAKAQIPVFAGDRLVGHVTAVQVEVGVGPDGKLETGVVGVWIDETEQFEMVLASEPPTPGSDPASAVWGHYVKVMEPRKKELDPETRRTINNALKVAEVDECNKAISGNKASSYHQGENKQGRKYNKISHILRGRSGQGPAPARTTRETIDFFLDIAAKSGVESHVPSVDPARVRQAKQDVRDALEFPGDERVVERGMEATRWLEQMGFAVVKDGSSVTFRPPA